MFWTSMKIPTRSGSPFLPGCGARRPGRGLESVLRGLNPGRHLVESPGLVLDVLLALATERGDIPL
jgi:hypothetical protein